MIKKKKRPKLGKFFRFYHSFIKSSHQAKQFIGNLLPLFYWLFFIGFFFACDLKWQLGESLF